MDIPLVQTPHAVSPAGSMAQQTAALESGQVVVYAFRTPDEARSLALVLSELCPHPEQAKIGLVELLINAVEHGNLGISYAQKTELVGQSALSRELERRLLLPEYRDKTATVQISRSGDALHFLIQDQGEGFDWQPFMELDPNRFLHPHGRGIAWARQVAFSLVEYRGTGSEVLAVVDLSPECPPSL
ncbi:MAG: ATP-binding protein [Magnetococcus sp. MYC-9]